MCTQIQCLRVLPTGSGQMEELGKDLHGQDAEQRMGLELGRLSAFGGAKPELGLSGRAQGC